MTTKTDPETDGGQARTTFTRPDTLFGPQEQKKLIKWLQYGLLLALLIYVAFPLYWTVSGAFRTPAALFKQPPNIAFFESTIDNFNRLLFETKFPRYFLNSVIVGIGATFLSTALATLGGYGITRATFRGKRNVARGVLFSYMFPPILLAIPLYTVFFNLGLLNSYFALMLAHTAITLPFSIWIMWQFFQTIPMEYEESAWISGAGQLRTFWEVVLPMARPGAIAIAIFSFALSWNDYTFAVVIMTDSNMQTLPVGVNTFIEQTAVNWGLVLSGGVLIMLPAFLLILFLQRYLLQGFRVAH